MDSAFLRMLIMTLVAVIAAALGDTFLSLGARRLGEMPAGFDLRPLLDFFGRAAANKWILAGVACLAVYFFTWLALLSWADLSLVLPMTALTFVLAAFLARYWLGEEVSWLRWAGTGVIALGVLLVTLSGRDKVNSLPTEAPPAVAASAVQPKTE